MQPLGGVSKKVDFGMNSDSLEGFFVDILTNSIPECRFLEGNLFLLILFCEIMKRNSKNYQK